MNGILLIDKARGITSHDEVARLRKILNERRIGHAGTLDPIATGLLVLFIGRATRAVEFAESDEKEYIAGLRLGLETDTMDITGKVIRTGDSRVSSEELEKTLQCFRGDISQVPPMYSAVKVNGQRLYRSARRGIEVERRPRQITVSKLEVLSESDGDILLRIKCSKGTYIRSLCRDIGEKTGCCGVMSSLRRLTSGGFSVEDAVSSDEAEHAARAGRIEKLIIPTDRLFEKYPPVFIEPQKEKKCRSGAPFAVEAPDGRYRIYSACNKEFLMLGSAKNGVMNTVKSFFEI